MLVGLFVVVEELSQAFIPSRTFDFVDLAADSVGIVIAVGIAYVANKHLTNVATWDSQLPPHSFVTKVATFAALLRGQTKSHAAGSAIVNNRGS